MNLWANFHLLAQLLALIKVFVIFHGWRDYLAERVLSHFLKPSQEDITKPLLNESVVISSISRATKNVFTGYIMFLSDSLQYRAVR